LEQYIFPVDASHYKTHPRDIFICYNNTNVIAARKIAEWMENHEGLSCWFANRNMPPNCNETELSLQMIEQSTVFVLISSLGVPVNHSVQVSHAMALDIERVEFKLSATGLPTYGGLSQCSQSGGFQNSDADWELALYALGRQIKKLISDAQKESDGLEAMDRNNQRPNFLYLFVLLIFVVGGVMTYTSIMPERANPGLDSDFTYDFTFTSPPLEERAHAGDRAAQYEYGRMLMLIQDYEEATYWFKQAAEQDHIMAQLALANNYRHGVGIERDGGLATYWDARAGSTYGMPEWQFHLANFYRDGFLVPPDPERALYWHRQSAHGGFLPAQSWLARLYIFGYGVARDYQQAAYWYKQAAIQGDVGSQTAIGTMYALGQGVDQSYENAAYWYRRAATHNPADFDWAFGFNWGNLNDWDISVAQVSLGVMYEYGFGVEDVDLDQAAFWYRSAAELGHPVGQNNLGIMYKDGRGVEQSYETAVYWFRLAAELGLPSAAAHLGLMYELGTGVEQDYEQAIYWYQRVGYGITISLLSHEFREHAPDWVEDRLRQLLAQTETQ